ncbi:peptidoglycan-binding domain-containing protein [Azospirillum griseum]|uniref:Peptidoglycan-binding protein n=1 Tax=Azospirillum griseum TaxID=2496639 RepID=A0A431VC18_9PROT|nr:peptidoglycan-binding domain-containing protein [Azospirillum griseum]RTR16260.1 peptidoglycan-binding protein [Azospirillum griseum]
MSGDRWRTLRGVAAAAAVASLAGVTELRAQQPATADIQWAQSILKEKGFDIGGRANGQMTAQTHAALSAYQKSVGLPATGQLDSATVAKMMGDREKKASSTMGSLSKSQIGQTPREKEVVPRAAPTQRVDSGNETVGGMAQFGSAPPSSSSSGGSGPARSAQPQTTSAEAPLNRSAADGPVPTAAPRAAVTATSEAGQPVPLVEPPAGANGLPAWMTSGLRYGVMGVLAATVGGIGFAWWRSGRAPAPVAPLGGGSGDGAPRDTRVEPSFGTRRREELTPGPRLTAEARRR